MKRFLLRLSVMALTLQVYSAGHMCLAASAGATSARRLGQLRIEQYGVYNAAKEISQKAHAPIGVDAILPRREPTIVLDFPGGTVADLLNMLVSRAPDYEWNEAEDGVIHVFRKHAQVSLLDAVMNFPGAENKTRHEIWEDLSKQPEILQWLKSNNCLRQEFFIGNEFKLDNDPISIAPGPITVRQLFDDVAVKSGANSWSVLESASPDGPCHVSLMLW
jgi:hypothetical protein